MGDAGHRQSRALCALARLGLVASHQGAEWTDEAAAALAKWRADCGMVGGEAVTPEDIAALECAVGREDVVP